MGGRSDRSAVADTVLLAHRAASTAGVSHREPARPALSTVLIALAVIVAVIGAVGYRFLPASSSPAPPDAPARSGPAASPGRPVPQADGARRRQPAGGSDVPRGERNGALTEADGLVPDGATVFDDDIAAVANLDPALRRALRRAATDAAGAGVAFSVNSGWRSRAYQDRLLREAVSKYGSEAEAARWVSTADTSLHVSGHAIDIGPARAAAWLSEHGAGYGLCQIYRNEPWHYELRPEAVDDGCPPPYADPTHDPRMQK
jgi:D-alanyl-D-alanine carboxypeptidase